MLAAALFLTGATASAISAGDAVTVANGDFSNGTTGWTVETGKLTTFNSTFDGTTVYGVEAYQSTFNIYQTLTGLENGVYAIRVQGFCREGYNYSTYVGGSYDESSTQMWVYGNGTEQRMKNLYDANEVSKTAYSSQNSQVADGVNVPDGVASAAEAFYNGKYWNEVQVNVADGTLTLGLKGTSDVGRWWCAFGNVSVTYLGELTDTLYTVTYMVNGKEVAKYSLTEGSTITTPADPVVQGYIFTGWDSLPGDMLMPAENLTVTAQFDNQTAIINGDWSNGTNGWYGTTPSLGGTSDNTSAEVFNSTFDCYQVLTGLPSGTYKLTAQAFYRSTGSPSDAWEAYYSGTPPTVNTYIYMNDNEQAVPNIIAEALTEQPSSGWTEASTGYYVPNNKYTGAEAFSKDMYQCQLLAIVTDGTLKLGIRNTAGGSGKGYWSMWDNFSLTYLGEEQIPQLTTLTADGTSILDQLDGTSVSYTMTYGVTSFPEVAATCDAGGTLTITQATVDNPQATITTYTASGIEVTTYTVKFVAGTPATEDDYITVATPAISISEGEDADIVTLSCTTPNAQIRYTLDGTDPTVSSPLYTEPITINSNLTLKAVGMLRAFNFSDSEVLTKEFTHFKTISGFSFTFSTGDGSTTDLEGDDTYSYIRTASSNPAFAIKGSGYVYSDARFKIGAGQKFAIQVPANAVVTKVTFNYLCENYYSSDDDNYALWSYIRSTGATCYYADTIRSATNAEVVVQNHQPGTDIEFSVASCRQVAFGSITIEYAQYNDGQMNLLTTSIVKGAVTEPSACLTMVFDRNATLVDGAQVTLDGQAVRTVATGSKVRAYYWELPYASTHTLTLAAGSVKDVFENIYGKPVTVTFTVKEQPAAEQALFDYVVSTPEELTTALSEVATANTSASAARKRILVLDGEYNMGGNQSETKVQGYNISLIGQSREGVRIYHTGNGGITGDATLVNSSKNFYMQDITVEHASSVREGNSRGVTVAYSGGNKAILKNVEMISGQDTYVTGDRTYHEDCVIHGTVDFICGGGANYFYRTDLLIEGGACITAAAQDASDEWGYVFRDCTVKPGTFISGATDGSYALGRPWKGEPRVAYINTKMNIKASNKGWNGMSYCVTHYGEYGSVDSNGNTIDLSTRTVSGISQNVYDPVLTADEAAEYNMYNVVGGDDGWVPSLYTVQAAAPTVTLSGSTLSWTAVSDALCYVVFKDGEYLGQTTDTTYAIDDTEATYTVRSANEMGGLGEAATATVSTGIEAIGQSDNLQLDNCVYDLQGRKIVNRKSSNSKLPRGIYIQNGHKVVR